MSVGHLAAASGREISTEDAATMAANFEEWVATELRSFAIEPADVDLAVRLVRRFDLGLRMPDALHAALCERRMLTVVTFDRQLARAAHSLGVTVVVPA